MNNMKNQGKKMIQTNLNSILIELNDCLVEEMSERDLRFCMIKMIHETKNEMRANADNK